MVVIWHIGLDLPIGYWNYGLTLHHVVLVLFIWSRIYMFPDLSFGRGTNFNFLNLNVKI